MGQSFQISCTNKSCKYSFYLREGPGFFLFAQTKKLEDSIKNGETDAPEDIKSLLQAGKKLSCVTSYLCSNCQEWQTDSSPYIFEAIHVSPYGTIREYKIHYVYGKPKCKKCGKELIHILNPKSSKNKCPKCGQENMRVSFYGFYD